MQSYKAKKQKYKARKVATNPERKFTFPNKSIKQKRGREKKKLG